MNDESTIFEWKDYSRDFEDTVNSFLDAEAVKNTGCDDGFNKYYEYWLADKETVFNKNFWCKVIFDGNFPIAVISVFKASNGEFIVSEFIVSPALRGKGYGTKILQELLSSSNKIIGQNIEIAKAVIFPSNTASRRVFEKAGFVYVENGFAYFCSKRLTKIVK